MAGASKYLRELIVVGVDPNRYPSVAMQFMSYAYAAALVTFTQASFRFDI
jgi:hypothetical protein